MPNLVSFINLTDDHNVRIADYHFKWWVRSTPFSNWSAQFYQFLTEVFSQPVLYVLTFVIQVVTWILDPNNMIHSINVATNYIFQNIAHIIPFLSIVLIAFGIYLLKLGREIAQAKNLALTESQSRRLTTNSIVVSILLAVLSHPITSVLGAFVIEEKVIGKFANHVTLGNEFGRIIRSLLWQMNFRDTLPARCRTVWDSYIASGTDANNSLYHCIPQSMRNAASSPNMLNLLAALFALVFAGIIIAFYITGITAFYSNYIYTQSVSAQLIFTVPKLIVCDTGYAKIQSSAGEISFGIGRTIAVLFLITAVPALLLEKLSASNGNIFLQLLIICIAHLVLCYLFYLLMPLKARLKVRKIMSKTPIPNMLRMIPILKKYMKDDNTSANTTHFADIAPEKPYEDPPPVVALPEPDPLLPITTGQSFLSEDSSLIENMTLANILGIDDHTSEGDHTAKASSHNTFTITQQDDLQGWGQSAISELRKILKEDITINRNDIFLKKLIATTEPAIPTNKIPENFSTWTESDNLPAFGSLDFIQYVNNKTELRSIDQGITGTQSPIIMKIPYGSKIAYFDETPDGIVSSLRI